MPQQAPNPCKCREYTWSLQNQLPSGSRFSVQWMDCSGKLHELKDTNLTSGTITCSSINPRFILNRVRYRGVTVVEGDCCCKCYEFSTSGSNPCFSRVRNCETNKFDLVSVEDMDKICSSIVPLSNCAWPTQINDCTYNPNTTHFDCTPPTPTPTPSPSPAGCFCYEMVFNPNSLTGMSQVASVTYLDCDTGASQFVDTNVPFSITTNICCSSIVFSDNVDITRTSYSCIYNPISTIFECNAPTPTPTPTCDCVTVYFTVDNNDLQAAFGNVAYPNYNHAMGLYYVDCDTQISTVDLVYHPGTYSKCVSSSSAQYSTMQYVVTDTTFVNYPNMDSTLSIGNCCLSGTTTTTTKACYTINSVAISQGSLMSSDDNTVYMFYENCVGDAITLSFNQSGVIYLDGTDCVAQYNPYFPEVSFWIFNGVGMREVTFQNDFELGSVCVVSTSTTRPCYQFSVSISQTDVNSATGNGNSYFDGKVFVGYTECGTGIFTINTYTASTTVSICIEEPIVSMYYFENDQYRFASNSSHTQTGNCSYTTTTTTGSVVTTTTTGFITTTTTL